jgi:MFS family permease
MEPTAKKSPLFVNPNFRWFFLADLVSNLGNGMSFIGLNWFVRQQTGANAPVALIVTANILGSFAALLFSGAIADRYDRRMIIRASNLVRGVLAAAVALTVLTGTFRVSYAYLLAVTAGAGWAVFMPAARGLIQELLPDHAYGRGGALAEISLQVGMFAAAGATGLIYDRFGFATILLIDAATFFVSNVFLRRIVHTSVRAATNSSYIREIAEGFRYLSQNRHVFFYGLLLSIPAAVTMCVNVVLPGYVATQLRASAVVFGIVDMAGGIGATVAGLVTAALIAKLSRPQTIGLLFLVSVASISLLAANTMIAGAFAGILLIGFSHSAIRVAATAHFMELVPTSHMGRTQAIWMAFSTILQVGSAWVVGWTMDAASIPLALLFLGILIAAGFAGLIAVFPRLSRT